MFTLLKSTELMDSEQSCKNPIFRLMKSVFGIGFMEKLANVEELIEF
jgi:hypothetical protein